MFDSKASPPSPDRTREVLEDSEGDTDEALASRLGRQMLSKVKRSPANGAAVTHEMLSFHRVLATYKGMLRVKPSRPSKMWATFKVDEYIHYEKPGVFGDPKLSEFSFVPEEQVPAVQEALSHLVAGDHVRLEWQHDYVTRQEGSAYPVGTGSYPVRTVLELSKLEE